MTGRLMLGLGLVTLVLATGCQPPGQPNPAAVAAAVNASDQWVAMVDTNAYAASWDAAAQYFRKAVPREQWVSSMEAFRAPLGAVSERKVSSSRYTQALPGAPDGQYVLIQYDSAFARKASAVETTTVMLDTDAVWRVSGYFIK